MKKILILLLLIVTSVWAQERSSRVAEVEGHIRYEVETFIKSLYPKLQFNAEVIVTPRYSEASKESANIPFFDIDASVELDPWEDENQSIYKLYQRIRQAKITINFGSGIEVTDQQNFKEKLLRAVALIPGRDQVELNFNAPAFINKSFSSTVFSSENMPLFVLSLIVAIVGILLATTLNKAIASKSKVVENTAADAGAAGPVMNPPMRTTSLKETRNTPQGTSNKLSVNDPTKSLNVIRSKIDQLVESESFPNLNDMIILENLLDNNLRSFSFLVYEFPKHYQDIIYAKGKADKWYKGFSEVGEMDTELFYVLDSMLRNRNYKFNKEFEQLLIQCWRMEDQLEDFFSFMARENGKEVMSILYHLPKSLSIKIARKMFPGNWGSLLAEETPNIPKDVKVVERFYLESQSIVPELEKNALNIYKNRKDLLDYLKICEVHEEEEIYTVLDKDNSLETARPPFYKFFNTSPELRRKVFQQFELGEWAIVCFNITRDYRKSLNEILNEKEKYLLGNYLSALDNTPPSFKERGTLRETIGKMIRDLNTSRVEIRPDEKELVQKVA